MRFVAEEWHVLSSDCIQQCFRYCFEHLLSTAISLNSHIVLQKQVINGLSERGAQYAKVEIEPLLNPENEDEVTAAVTLDNQVA